MGQISVETMRLPGSALGGNQQPSDLPPDVGGPTVVTLLLGALSVLAGVIGVLFGWGRGQADARIADHKEHTRDYVAGMQAMSETTRAMDEARRAMEARDGDR